jgi:3-methylcrotonyl-CoA carboxylase alpha subunit
VGGDTPIRIDSGVREGDTITPHYDPMIAKIIAWGETREQARLRLMQALAATRIAGLQTNVPFLHRLLGLPAFAQGRVDTGLIVRHQDALLAPPAVPMQTACAAVVGALLDEERAQQTDDPWSARDGFSNGILPPRSLRLDSPWGELSCTLLYPAAGQPMRLLLPGQATPQLLACSVLAQRAGHDAHARTLLLTLGEQRMRVEVLRLPPLGWQVFGAGEQVVLSQRAADHGTVDAAHAGGTLAAPMPGKIIAVHVQIGQVVQAGEPLLVLEAMKMEHTLSAPAAGCVTELLHTLGDQVGEGDELLRIEAQVEAAA